MKTQKNLQLSSNVTKRTKYSYNIEKAKNTRIVLAYRIIYDVSIIAYFGQTVISAQLS